MNEASWIPRATAKVILKQEGGHPTDDRTWNGEDSAHGLGSQHLPPCRLSHAYTPIDFEYLLTFECTTASICNNFFNASYVA